jgi:predicted DNA-binding transcriptional regulator YafY
MTDQKKLRKMLEILLLISGNIKYTKKYLCQKFNTSERTIYRYFETFRQVGFVLENNDGYYHINKNQSTCRDISELLHFSEEEAYILSKAIHSVDDNNTIKSNLVKKLYALYDFDRVAKTIVKKEHSENVHAIIHAFKEKKQVVLKNYVSASSNRVSDRLVEPFDFTTNYISVWCYEPGSQANKLFKTARIGKVETTQNPWQNEDKHKQALMDVFRISSHEKIPVKLLLNTRAASLLTEEYPMAEEFMQPTKNDKYLFDGWVCSFEGIGRFILGLPGEIEIINPATLKTYLTKRIAPLQKVLEAAAKNAKKNLGSDGS